MKDFTINTIALRYMKTHRRQYVTLTLSIVLALFFTAMLLVFWQSTSVSLRELHEATYGRQDMILKNITEDDMQTLVEDGLIERYGMAKILGYVFPEETSEEHRCSLAVFDDTARELVNYSLLSGHFPSKKGEVALESATLLRLAPNAQVGDTLELLVRTPDGQGGFLPAQTRRYTLTGILSNRSAVIQGNGSPGERKEYTDIPAGYLSSEEVVEAGGQPVLDAYAMATQALRRVRKLPDLRKFSGLAELQERIEKEMQDEDYAITHYDWDDFVYWVLDAALPGKDISVRITKYGDDVNREEENIETARDTSRSLGLLAAVLIVASCIGIINAFAQNLSGRQQQIGMLRAVAATKRQIRQIFGREALVLALVSIVPATGLACLAVRGLLWLLWPEFRMVVSVPLLVAVAAAGLVCILLAVCVPLWRYSSVPPMQAVRNVGLSRRMHRAKLRSKKRFSVPGHMAKRQLRLSRGTQLGAIALTVLGMLTLSWLTYVGNLKLPERRPQEDFRLSSEYSHEVAFFNNVEFISDAAGISEADRQDVAALPTVERVYGDKSADVYVIPQQITNYLLRDGAAAYVQNLDHLLDEGHRRLLPSEFVEDVEERRKSLLGYAQKFGLNPNYYIRSLRAMDRNQLTELEAAVIEGEIHPNKLDSGEEVLVIAPSYGYWYEENLYGDRYEEWYGEEVPERCKEENIFPNDMFHVGDTLKLSYVYSQTPEEFTGEAYQIDAPQHTDREVTIGAVLTLPEDGAAGSYWDVLDAGGVITSDAGMEELLGMRIDYTSLGIYLSEKPDQDMERYLLESLDAIAARTVGAEAEDVIASSRQWDTVLYTKFSVSMALVILIFAACACVINTSITARIEAGRRTIGILRAVGASGWEITQMYVHQLVRIIGTGALLGLLLELGFLFPFRWWRTVHGYAVEAVPLCQPLLFAALLFALCCLTVWRRLRQVLRFGIVQNIREL